MPDINFETLDAVPAELREYAKDQGGKITVSVVAKTKLDEFRNNNITVSQERDTFKSSLARAIELLGTEDFDAAGTELQGLRSTQQQVKDGKLVADTSLEAAVADRTRQMRETLEGQIAEKARETASWRERAGSLDGQLRRGVIERAVASAVLSDESGADPRALQDITSRAFNLFQVTDDGKLIAKKGDEMVYGEDGVKSLTPSEWLKQLRQETPYFFKSSNGGGAGGGGNEAIRHHGMTDAEFQKLPAAKRLELANRASLRK